MGVASGIQSQIGFAAESTVGTRVTPNRFVEFVGENLKFNRSRIKSRGMRAGRRVNHRWAAGIGWVDGGFTIELAPQATGLLFKHAFGGVSTSGTGPYTHTFTPGALDNLGLTIQVNRPDVGGTDRPFDYLGCQVVDWELAAEVDQFAMFTANVYGAHEQTDQSLASASYPSSWSPFVFTHGSVSLDGSAFDVKSIRLQGNNGLSTGRHRISATNPERPRKSLESAVRTYGGSISADFTLPAYQRFVNGTEAALVLAFDAGAAAQLTITTNVRFDGETPNVASIDDLIDLSLPFEATSATSDAAAITVELVNSDSTP